MSDAWDEPSQGEPWERPQRKSKGRGRSRNRDRRRRRERTPEERALEEARRAADRKLKFVQHFISYAFVVLLLLVIARPAAVIVALAWGIGIVSDFFRSIIAPDLRRKWVRSEVEQRVAASVSRERVALEGEKLRSLEELSASIAHEIRNPITAAKSLVQQMGEDPGSGENVEYAHVALEELDRVERSISHLLRYAREEAMNREPVRLAAVVEDALDVVRDRIEAGGIEVRRDLENDAELEGDPEKLRRVVINLLGNAIEAFAEGSTVGPRIDVAVGENLAGDRVWMRVRDNGPGMSAETRARVFSPFFTSKEEGTGLGLAISRKLVDAHGGQIELSSEPGKGTEFVLTFPKHHEAETSS